MGNSVSGSKDRHIDESVDFGFLCPQGVYTGPQDWNQQVVGHLIVDRKLAPFYRPLEDYDEEWDDDRILASRKENPNAPPPPLPEPPSSASSSKFHHHRAPNKAGKEPFRPTEASVYRGAVECPICFLYYPPNINRSRCCDQAICTECFVQIKRAEPTTTHLISEPASCPYCVQENFGITYAPPPWRTGLMGDAATAAASRPHMQKVSSASSADSEGTRRRKSFSADSPDVVTIDQIRPDWEAKLAAVRAAVTRRANRRIIMRQVGDRLIPIGVTSGRVHGAEGAEGAEGEGGTGRRSRRRNHGGQDLNQLMDSVGLGGLGGQDLDELMLMEAMRLSLLDHEEHQRRQNQNNNDENGNSNSNATPATNGTDSNASPASSTSPSPRPSSSPPTDPPQPSSPVPSPSNTPARQSPLRNRLLATPSPLRNTDNTVAMSVALPGSAPPGIRSHPSPPLEYTGSNLLRPPEGRTHRRTGSSPGSPSSGALAAALHAAHTATAFLGPPANEGRTVPRHGQNVPRSAPETRAPSPGPVAHGPREVTRHLEAEAPVLARHISEAEEAPGPAASSSSHVLATSPAPLAGTPASEVSEDALERDRAGYEPLLSSMESSAGDPLLDWDK